MTLPKEFTTVTPFSKILALILFIVLPFIGFILGMYYQTLLNQVNQESSVIIEKQTASHFNETSSPTVVQQPSPTNGSAIPYESCIFPELHFKANCPSSVSAYLGTVAYKTTAMIYYYGKYQSKNNPGWVDGFTIHITYELLGESDLYSKADQIRKSFYDGDKYNMKPIKFGNISGYQIAGNDQGSGATYIVGNGTKGYNQIDIMVLDTHNLGYKEIADQILSSYTILP